MIDEDKALAAPENNGGDGFADVYSGVMRENSAGEEKLPTSVMLPAAANDAAIEALSENKAAFADPLADTAVAANVETAAAAGDIIAAGEDSFDDDGGAAYNGVLRVDNSDETRGRFQFLENERNLEFPPFSAATIDPEAPLTGFQAAGEWLKRASDYQIYMDGIQSLGAEAAEYKWAYDQGKMGEFDAKKFGKEALKAGARGLMGETVKTVGNMLYMFGANLEGGKQDENIERSGFAYYMPKAGKLLQDIGSAVSRFSEKVENIELLAPAADIYEEQPTWTKVANVLGQGSAQVLAMGAMSKYIGAAPTYAWFAGGGALDVFHESYEKDQNIGKARTLAAINGATTFAIDKLFSPLPDMVEKNAKVTSKMIAKEIIGAPLREAGTEVLQQMLAENLVRQVGIDDTQDLFEGLIESALGAIAGSTALVGANGSTYYTRKGYEAAREKIMRRGVTSEDVEACTQGMLDFMMKKPEAFEKILSASAEENLRQLKKAADTPDKKTALKAKKAEEKGFKKIYKTVYNKALQQTGDEHTARVFASLMEADAKILRQLGSTETADEFLQNQVPEIKKMAYDAFREKYDAAAGISYMFGGVKAKNADWGRYAKALEMEAKGYDPQFIWAATGWHRGSEGLMRFEFSDREARLKIAADVPALELPKQYWGRYLNQLQLMETDAIHQLIATKEDFVEEGLRKMDLTDGFYADFIKFLGKNYQRAFTTKKSPSGQYYFIDDASKEAMVLAAKRNQAEKDLISLINGYEYQQEQQKIENELALRHGELVPKGATAEDFVSYIDPEDMKYVAWMQDNKLFTDTLFEVNTSDYKLTGEKELLSGQLKDILWSYQGKKVYNPYLEKNIGISGNSIKKYIIFSRNDDKKLLVPYLPDILAKAIFTKFQNTYAPEREPGVVGYYKAYFPIIINGKKALWQLSVREENNGFYFYDLQADKEPLSAETVRLPGAERGDGTPSLLSDIRERGGNVKGNQGKKEPLSAVLAQRPEAERGDGTPSLFSNIRENGGNVKGNQGKKEPLSAVLIPIPGVERGDGTPSLFSNIRENGGNVKGNQGKKEPLSAVLAQRPEAERGDGTPSLPPRVQFAVDDVKRIMNKKAAQREEEAQRKMDERAAVRATRQVYPDFKLDSDRPWYVNEDGLIEYYDDSYGRDGAENKPWRPYFRVWASNDNMTPMNYTPTELKAIRAAMERSKYEIFERRITKPDNTQEMNEKSLQHFQKMRKQNTPKFREEVALAEQDMLRRVSIRKRALWDLNLEQYVDLIADLERDWMYRRYLIGEGDYEAPADMNYFPPFYRKAYAPALMSEKFLSQPQYAYLTALQREKAEDMLEDVYRVYRLHREIAFAKEAQERDVRAANAYIAENYANGDDSLRQYWQQRLMLAEQREFKLGDLLEHPKLYENYPGFEDITVRFAKLENNDGYHFYRDQQAGREILEIDPESLNYRSLKDVLLRGAAFAIQMAENFDLSLSDTQRRNFMDRHVYLAKNEIMPLMIDKLRHFLHVYVPEANPANYIVMKEMPVSLLNLYGSEAEGSGAAKTKEMTTYMEIDYDKLERRLEKRYAFEKLKPEQIAIRNLAFAALQEMKRKENNLILSEANMASGYWGPQYLWGGVTTQGETDIQAILRRQNYDEWQRTFPYWSGDMTPPVKNKSVLSEIHLDYLSEAEENRIKARNETDFMTISPDDAAAYDGAAEQYLDKAKGAYSYLENAIYLFENAGLDALIHESFHAFRRMLESAEMRNNPKVREIYRDSMAFYREEVLKSYNLVQYRGRYMLLKKTAAELEQYSRAVDDFYEPDDDVPFQPIVQGNLALKLDVASEISRNENRRRASRNGNPDVPEDTGDNLPPRKIRDIPRSFKTEAEAIEYGIDEIFVERFLDVLAGSRQGFTDESGEKMLHDLYVYWLKTTMNVLQKAGKKPGSGMSELAGYLKSKFAAAKKAILEDD